MRRTTLILILLVLAHAAYAVIATPEPIIKQLPDGTTQQVFIHGDEHYHYLSLLDGTPIPGTEVGDNTAVSDYTYNYTHRAPNKTQLTSYVPDTGTVHIPVILVNFTDKSFTLDNPRQQFHDLYNINGGSNPNATGSVHDYYLASSDSILNLIFDVYGPYDLSREMAYYGSNSDKSHNVNAAALIVEAATLARSAGVDFTIYDNNDDGYIDNLSVVVAGYNEAEGGPENAIWPHYSRVTSTETFSRKHLAGYLVISEYRGYETSYSTPTQAGIGTYCHEFGHALGLPDLYDTENSSRYTVGTWDVMCSGSYNNYGSTPPTFTAFERFMKGWLTPQQLQQANNYVLPPIETSNKAYLITEGTHNILPSNPTPSEFFLIENRQALGWDAGNNALVGTGLMISHITFSQTKWDRNTFNNDAILGFAIVSATGINAPARSSAADLFPGTNNVTTWVPALNSGTKLIDQRLLNIRQLNNQDISFFYGINEDKGLFFSPLEVDDVITTYDKRPIEYNTKEVTLSVKDINSDSITISSSTNLFQFSLDSGETWLSSTQLLVNKDSSYTIPLTIRHNPERQNCNVRTGYISVQTTDERYFNQLQVQGSAPRPTYITTPVITSVHDVTKSSFAISWEEQTDADYYYATLYSVSPIASTNKQDFETFSTIAAIQSAGWDANFARLTNAIAEEKYAVMFSQTGEHLTTEKYIEAPVSIRFWLSNAYTPIADESTANGQLLLQASADGVLWDSIENIQTNLNTLNQIKEYDMREHDYNQFRFIYTHTRGNGGPVIDNFTATLEKTISYVCKGKEEEIPGTAQTTIFSNLQEGTTYYCSIQAYEDKGCEQHLSELSPVTIVRTLGGENNNIYLTIRRNEDNTYTAIMPEPLADNATLYIFDCLGHIIDTADVPVGDTEIAVPATNLIQNNLYILKVMTNKLRRKAAKGKLFYHVAQ